MLILSPKAGFQSRSRGRRRRRGRSIRASLRCDDYGFLLRVNMLSTAHNHYQHVTVHFSSVVLLLRCVVELFRVVVTTEYSLLSFCRFAGNSRISLFRLKGFDPPALIERESK